jgi:hypothetical protein
MYLMAADPTPLWAILLVGAIGGVGGSVVIGGINLLNAKAERKHARDLKKQERQHDLQVRQLEDQQRLRDERLRLLRSGLVEAVDGVADLNKVAFLTQWGDQETRDKKAALASALAHYESARARLILDPAGAKVAQSILAIAAEIDHYSTMVGGQAEMLRAHAPGAEQHGEAVEQQRKKIDVMIQSAITTARQIIGELAQPISAGNAKP